MAGLSIVPPPAPINFDAEDDAFWAAVADATKDALDQVSPDHPNRQEMRKFTSSVHKAAGRPPVWTAS
jgi:hypothetical protein